MAAAKRWKVEATYRTGAPGTFLVEDHAIEELFELHDWIERGPDWTKLESIVITYVPYKAEAA